MAILQMAPDNRRELYLPEKFWARSRSVYLHIYRFYIRITVLIKKWMFMERPNVIDNVFKQALRIGSTVLGMDSPRLAKRLQAQQTAEAQYVDAVERQMMMLPASEQPALRTAVE
jgi:hypothetical protein